MTGIVSSTFKHNIAIYPNPTQGTVSVDLGRIYHYAEITIIRTDGQVMGKYCLFNSRYKDIQMPGLPGPYMFSITSGNERAVLKILKR